MDKAKEFLDKLTTGELSDSVSRLTFRPHRPPTEPSFYEYFAIRGHRVAAVRLDFVSCSFKVPPRLLDGDGNLAMAAITTLIDFMGAAVAYRGYGRAVSTDVSISRLSTAKLGDELEMESKCTGRKGGYSGRTYSYGTKQVEKLLLKAGIRYIPVSANCDIFVRSR